MTYKQFFKKYLSPKDLEKALNNMKNFGDIHFNEKISDSPDPLSEAFIWKHTPEGQEYWSHLNAITSLEYEKDLNEQQEKETTGENI